MSFTKEEINNFMEECFKYCNKAIENGEIPVGCIFVHNLTKQILYGSHNLTNKTKNANSHCEINCIKYFTSKLPYKISDEKNKVQYDYNKLEDLMQNCTLFVSCEPCIMCAYALNLIHISKVYFGCYNDKFGGNGSIVSIHKFNLWTYKSEGGFLKDQAIQYLRQFYSVGNKKAPENKRQRKLISEQ
jgi:tRNA(Arg) A34 adenosine deaminase TadA